MSYARRTTPRRRPEEPEPAAELPAPAPPGPAVTPAQVLALQRAGVGNRLLARQFDGDETDEDEGEAELESAGKVVAPPAPFPPLDLELPIVIPREHLPPELLAMFGLQPEPPLLLEYHPLEEEREAETEPEPEPEPEPEAQTQPEPPPEAPTPTVQEAPEPKRRGKGRGKAKAKQEQVTGATDLNQLSLEEQLAAIEGAGTQPKGGKKKAPPQKKKTEAQKRHEREQRKRKEKGQADDLERERQMKEKEDAERAAELKARTGLITMLNALKSNLAAERNKHPNRQPYRAIRSDANAGIADLDAYLSGPAKTASSEALRAKADEVNKLIARVRNFTPPETPEQRRTRRFEEIKTNISIAFGREEWTGPKGGLTDFTVDKNDVAMRQLIRNHYGRDTVEVPGHEDREYPGKTKTTKVYYYVTGTSNTPGIAYDISLHAWDDSQNVGTVHVLHIPHKAE